MLLFPECNAWVPEHVMRWVLFRVAAVLIGIWFLVISVYVNLSGLKFQFCTSFNDAFKVGADGIGPLVALFAF